MKIKLLGLTFSLTIIFSVFTLIDVMPGSSYLSVQTAYADWVCGNEHNNTNGERGACSTCGNTDGAPFEEAVVCTLCGDEFWYWDDWNAHQPCPDEPAGGDDSAEGDPEELLCPDCGEPYGGFFDIFHLCPGESIWVTCGTCSAVGGPFQDWGESEDWNRNHVHDPDGEPLGGSDGDAGGDADGDAGGDADGGCDI